MSSSSSSVQNGPPPGGFWPSYAMPSVAATFSMIPMYHFFVRKSAAQLGQSVASTTFKKAFIESLKASPAIGAAVGVQLGVQKPVENFVEKRFHSEGFVPKLTSSTIVALITALPLTVFNDLCARRFVSVPESLRTLSPKALAALTARETSFLFAMRITDPISKAMKDSLGDNKAVEYGSTFMTGVVSAAVGHAPDTAFTRWKVGLTVESLLQLASGAPWRLVGVGGFFVGFKLAKETFNR